MSYVKKMRDQPRNKSKRGTRGAKPSVMADASPRALLVCSSKHRHADEATARSAAMTAIELYKKVDRLHVYKCPVCHGWHLTRKPNGMAVTASDPVFVPRPEDEVFRLIQTGPTTSVFGALAKTRNLKWIHQACLMLEQEGRIERKSQHAGQIVWVAASGAP